MTAPRRIVVDSATALPAGARGAVGIVGSHAGVYAAWLSARAGLAAAIHHAAGVGRDGAGIAGLAWADGFGFAMAAIAGASARIGDGADMARRGRVGHVNEAARRAGVAPGMAADEAARRIEAAPPPVAPPPAVAESRRLVDVGGAAIPCVDSISLVAAEDAGRIVSAGSHGGLPAARYALGLGARLVLFNDAGDAAEGSGIAGLALLAEARAAAVAVSAASARIGDGVSTLRDGIVSAVNAPAEALGARVGEAALGLVRRLSRPGA